MELEHEMDSDCRLLLLRAIGSVVVTNKVFHPNHQLLMMVVKEMILPKEYLLKEMSEHHMLDGHKLRESDLDTHVFYSTFRFDDVDHFVENLRELKESGTARDIETAARAMVFLFIAMVVDGHYTKDKAKLLNLCFQTLEWTSHADHLKALIHAFRAAEGITLKDFEDAVEIDAEYSSMFHTPKPHVKDMTVTRHAHHCFHGFGNSAMYKCLC
jgi:hypothetical protein